MRKYTIPLSMSVEYLLGDHLGSTSITTDANGAKVSELRYKPWGEVRFAWTASLSTTPAYELAKYTFTGQYSYMDDPSTAGVTEGFGLMFYNARWYDPYLNYFTQPDTIVPDPYNPQDWNRYSYVRNNPIRYTDPSGHNPECGPDGIFCYGGANVYHGNRSFVVFRAEDNQSWTDQEQKIIQKGVNDIAYALALEYSIQGTNLNPAQAFNRVFGGYIVANRASAECGCWAEHQGKVDGHYTINFYSSTTADDILDHPKLLVHETGHALMAALGINGNNFDADLLRPTNSDGIIGTGWVNGERTHYGYYGGHYDWQFGKSFAEHGQYKEEIADMFVGWVYGMWENSDLGKDRADFMQALMVDYLP